MYTTSLVQGGVIPPQVAVGGRFGEILFSGTLLVIPVSAR
jgi:hypothetical protein